MPESNSVSRRHRYVPQFYLKTWQASDGNGIWLQSSPVERHRLKAWQTRGDHLCSQTDNCVYILSFGLRTGCRDCYYATTNCCESNQCCTAKPGIVAVAGQTIACLSKQCSGWQEPGLRGVISRQALDHGIRCSDAFRVGRTKVSGRRFSPRSARTQTSRKCFSTVRLCGRTSTQPAHPKKRATKSWPFSWGLEYQDLCGG